MQEVDTHLPLVSQFKRLRNQQFPTVKIENSAFVGKLEGVVQYATDENEEIVKGAVQVEHLLSLIGNSTPCIFEFDSRHAPLNQTLVEYYMASCGKHPIFQAEHVCD